MRPLPRVRVYLACSLDGYIAGPEHDLDWLHADHSAPGDLPTDPNALRFEAFLGQIGAMLMGRTTYDVVNAMGVWPYGELPVHVATHRPLASTHASVTAVGGPIETLVAAARDTAGARDVYLDGGDLVQQALNAGLVDELTLTIVPILLGRGIRLFERLDGPLPVHFIAHRAFDNGTLQLTLRRR